MTHSTRPRPHCRYHAEHAGRWHCETCRLSLCSDCKPYCEQLPLEVRCPLCAGAMSELAAPGDEPESLAALMARSTQAVPLGAALAAALTFGLVGWPLPGLPVAIPVFAAFAGCLAILARRAGEGNREALKLRDLSDVDTLEFWARSLAFALPFAALFLVAAAGPSWLLPVAVAATGALAPAALMATVIDGTALAAFDPRKLHHIISTLQGTYTRTALVTLALVTAFTLPAIFVEGALAAPVHFASGLAAALASIVWSQWVGQLLRSNRRILDYEAGVDPLERTRPPEAAVYEPALFAADAEVLLAEGRPRDARSHLGVALTRYPDDPALNRHFDELVRSSSTPAEYRAHLERRIQRLVRSGQFEAAVLLWQRNSSCLARWMPRHFETRFRLALALDDHGEHQAAFRMLISLSPKAARGPSSGDAWLEAARILEHHLGDPLKARDLRRAAQSARRENEPAQAPNSPPSIASLASRAE
jgi:hypothetical protein